MGYDYSAFEWFCKYPELFENSDYIKSMLLKLKTIQHNLDELTDYYADNYVSNKNPYASPFFYDVRNMNRDVERWTNKFHELYNKIEHDYNITEIDMLETNNSIFVYIGLLDDDYWFFHAEDNIYIYDSKPLDEKDESENNYEWHDKHLITTLKPSDKTKGFYQQMYNLLNERDLSEYSQNIYQEHFENLLKEIEETNHEI